MKTIYTLITASLVVLLFGCQGYFDRSEIGLLTQDKVDAKPSKTAIESSVITCYPLLGVTANQLGYGAGDWDAGLGFRPDIITEDIAAGDLLVTWDPRSDVTAWRQVETLNFSASTNIFRGVWGYNFEEISRVNLALSYLNDTSVMNRVIMDLPTKNKYIGELLFLRAYSYFALVTNFGDVPLMLAPIASFEDAYSKAKRSPASEIWVQIFKDLKEAKDLLPSTKFSSSAEPWRISKGAVLAMLAKASLYQKQYADVITYVAQLDALNFFKLNSDYYKAFNTDFEFADDEVILTHDHTNHVNPNDPWNGNVILQFFSWGFFGVTTDFFNEFETNDPRRDLTVDMPNRRIWKLMGDKKDTYYGNADSKVNRVIIRYADVLLWKAEALMMSGKVSEGITALNLIRKRARLSPTFSNGSAPVGTLPDRDVNANKDQAFKWLDHERRVELGMENCRFSDLRRWGLDVAKAKMGARGFQDHYMLYPVPQTEIDKTGGALTQNPGY